MNNVIKIWLLLFCVIAAVPSNSVAQATTQTPTPASRAAWTTSPPFVQRQPFDDPDGYENFDDIVRYKTRAQMQISEDDYRFSYKGPQIAVAFGNHIRLMNFNCGRLEAGVSTSNTASITNYSAYAFFMPRNTHLFTYSPHTGTCQMFPITGTSLGAAATGINAMDDGGTASACPTAADFRGMNMSPNGYLAVGYTTTTGNWPYLRIFRFANGKFSSLLPVVPAISYSPTMLSFNGDATMLAVSDGTNTTFYGRATNDLFTQLDTSTMLNVDPPLPMTATTAAIAFSPDNKYFVRARTAGGSSVALARWSVDMAQTSSRFTALTSLTIASSGTATVTAMAFSPDSKYLAVAGGNATTSNGYLRLYKIEPNNVFAEIRPSISGVSGINLGGYESTSTNISISALAFAPDSSYLVAAVDIDNTATMTPRILVIEQITPTIWGAYSALQQSWTSGYMPKHIAVRW